MNILLIRLRLIGDVVFTTPAIGAIRRMFPAARISYLVEPAAAPVVRDHPAIDEVIVVERPRGVFVPGLPVTAWTRTLSWLEAHTPASAHVLADPGHAWRHGVPVRVTGHDVYLEDVKDTAMALYSRAVAQRVIDRTRDLGDFDALTPDKARALATRYDLDYLISTAKVDLPLVSSHGRFHVYRLRP